MPKKDSDVLESMEEARHAIFIDQQGKLES